jgi:hypothetical protein
LQTENAFGLGLFSWLVLVAPEFDDATGLPVISHAVKLRRR